MSVFQIFDLFEPMSDGFATYSEVFSDIVHQPQQELSLHLLPAYQTIFSCDFMFVHFQLLGKLNILFLEEVDFDCEFLVLGVKLFEPLVLLVAAYHFIIRLHLRYCKYIM